MSDAFIIAIDQGTTGSRVNCLNKKGERIGSAYKEFTQHFPKPGWVEHDAMEIWGQIEGLITEACSNAGLDAKNIQAIGITNQRETTVIWDRKTGIPIHNAIVWQCRRTSAICEKLKEEGHVDTFHEKTGLILDAYFSGTKISWILDHVEGARDRAKNGELAFGTIDSWLLYKLTGGESHKSDFTNASRTLLYNIQEKKWDKELCSILNVPMELLPRVENTAADFGSTKNLNGVPDGIPISAMIGDQQAALFGNLCFSTGSCKNTYGTGCFILMNMGQEFSLSKHGLLTTLVADKEGKPSYALEGAIFIGGAVIQWLRDGLKMFPDAAVTEEMAFSIANTKEEDVVFVPAFAGLGAPYWDAEARGAILGITRGTTEATIAWAALKAIALQSYEVFKVMEEDSGVKIKKLKVDGGATANNFLMQYQADIMNTIINRPQNIETTALGAAFLAGIQSGFWKDTEELKSLIKVDRTFEPKMSKEKREREVRVWKDAVKRILTK